MVAGQVTGSQHFRGTVAFVQGMSAEDAVARAYIRSGFEILDRRWKSCDGEIDIVARHGEKFYFIEVKSSITHERAAQALGSAQMQRILNAALHYLGEKLGTVDVDCRFDAALVDQIGRVKVLPGAFVAS